MQQLNDLANGLPPEERDRWIERVTRMTSRLEENDEMRILLESIAMVSETVDKRLEAATAELKKAAAASQSPDHESLAKAIAREVMFPDLSELRTYLRRNTEQNEKAEEIQKAEHRSLKQAEKLLRELKALNGKSFFFWALFTTAIITGVATGILATWLVQTQLFQ